MSAPTLPADRERIIEARLRNTERLHRWRRAWQEATGREPDLASHMEQRMGGVPDADPSWIAILARIRWGSARAGAIERRARPPAQSNANVVRFPRWRGQLRGATLPRPPGPEAA